MSGTIIVADARQALAQLEPESVQCIVTSPPYWGLRDYGTATWIGGDALCDHRAPTMRPGRNENRPLLAGSPASNSAHLINMVRQRVCGKCGAVREDQQIGLEASPREYLLAMRRVFRAAWRVLKRDGTLWLNMGDSYAAQRGGSAMPAETLAGGAGGFGDKNAHRGRAQEAGLAHRNARLIGLKHKDLVGMPWRLALSLQRDGWYLRSDIVWSKPNPMPESVKDRPTRSHEYVFLLSKRARYYYDADAIREPQVTDFNGDGRHPLPPAQGAQPRRKANGVSAAGYDDRKWKDRSDGVSRPPMTMKDRNYNPAGRNRRSVWEIATQPFPEAHFATFPEALVEPCILAGSRRGDTVLDPFTGSGTTGLVADRLGRDFIGIELNPRYAALAQQRIRNDAPLLADVKVVTEEATP